jgi:hypothetical protein
MISFPLSRFAMAGALSLAFACSSSESGSSTNGFPAMTLSDHQKIAIALSTLPTQPPVAGLDAVQVVLTEPTTGEPIEDEQITLVPWMPTMGHGTDVIPQIHSLGKGRYLFTNVNLYMPGEWLLRFEFSGKVTDSALQQILFNVQ